MTKPALSDILQSAIGLAIVCSIFALGLWLSPWLQLPAALIGLLVLLGVFICLGRIPQCILLPWQFMLKHMSLFFVPAFVSVPLYQAQLVTDFWALFLTVFVSTLLCMAILARFTQHKFARWLKPEQSDD